MDASHVLAVPDERDRRPHVWRERHLAMQSQRTTSRPIPERRQSRYRLWRNSLGRSDGPSWLAAGRFREKISRTVSLAGLPAASGMDRVRREVSLEFRWLQMDLVS